MSRSHAQYLIFAIWVTGLIGVLAIYIFAIGEYEAHPAQYGLNTHPDWGEQIQKRFDGPLAAIYAPWIAVMIAAIVGESSTRKQEKISRGLVTFAALGCFILQIMLVYMLWVSMLKTQPLESQMPLGSALLALLISVVGAFVTYSFPAQDASQNQIPPQVEPGKPTP